MGMALWIIAVVVAIMGLMALINGNLLWGIILLVIAAAVGPGGGYYSGRRV